jgi:hypothetical protein
MGRILTIQIDIVDDVGAAWIWHNHMNNNPTHGLHVRVIHEGPMPEEREDADESPYAYKRIESAI